MDYTEALRKMPAPGSKAGPAGCHPHILRTANLGCWVGLTHEQIAADIRQAIPSGSRHVPDREIYDAIKKASKDKGQRATSNDRATWTPHNPASRPKLDADGLRGKIMMEGSPDEVDLWEASPTRLCGHPDADAVLLLRYLYRPDEFLFMGDIYGKTALPVERWIAWIEQNGTTKLPHVIPNPLDGKEHETSTGTMSQRCDAAVKSFRFAVVEFDDIPRDDQLRFWSGILRHGLLNVACLLDSGGKSIHAWVNVDVPSRAVWEREVKQRLFTNWLIPLGVDPATKNPARLSRLPGHHRTKTGRWQRLLWLQQKGNPR